MARITISIDEEQKELIDRLSGDDGGYDSRSAVMRECIHRYEEVNRLRSKVERLENEKRMILEQREEHTELVEYVEHEREVDRQRDRRRQAPAWRRAKWWLLGEPDLSDDK